MFAIVRHKGHQYRVEEGDTFLVDLMGLEKGTSFDFEEVLMKEGQIGTPTVEGSKVTGVVVTELVKAKKVYTLKYRRRKNSSRSLRGHRQKHTLVQVQKIS